MEPFWDMSLHSDHLARMGFSVALVPNKSNKQCEETNWRTQIAWPSLDNLNDMALVAHSSLLRLV